VPRHRLSRSLSPAEIAELRRLANARTVEVRLAERARVVLAVCQGATLGAAAAQVGHGATFASDWVHRVEKEGLAGLHDAPRSGRPGTYTHEEKGRLIATALTHPDALGLPFGHWTLDRLTAYANETLGLPMSRAHVGRVLHREGIRWYKESTYFSERPDPEAFAEKRGPSFASISSRLSNRS
jgi:transposase